MLKMLVGHLTISSLSLFIRFSVQTVSNGDRGNVTRLPCSLEYLRRVDGVIPPRASGDPILEGKALLVFVVVSMSQPA